MLARGMTEQIRKSERTSDFRKIPPKDLQLAAAEVYRNLGEWLLQKTEHDIEGWFKAIGIRRAAEGVRLHQFVWALMLTRDHLWHFLQQEEFFSVDDRAWVRQEDHLEGLALTQLAPGPLAAQLAM